MLAAYSLGMPALFVDRIVAASFLSRGDTATPMKVTLVGVALNVALKILLYRPLGAPGLALGTAAGLWLKVGGVYALARRRGWAEPDDRFIGAVAATLFASGALALALTLADAHWSPPWRDVRFSARDPARDPRRSSASRSISRRSRSGSACRARRRAACSGRVLRATRLAR